MWVSVEVCGWQKSSLSCAFKHLFPLFTHKWYASSDAWKWWLMAAIKCSKSCHREEGGIRLRTNYWKKALDTQGKFCWSQLDRVHILLFCPYPVGSLSSVLCLCMCVSVSPSKEIKVVIGVRRSSLSSSCGSSGYYSSSPTLSSSPPVLCNPKSGKIKGKHIHPCTCSSFIHKIYSPVP